MLIFIHRIFVIMNIISQKGNLIDLLHKMKDQRLKRFIGFSLHANDIYGQRGRFG